VLAPPPAQLQQAAAQRRGGAAQRYHLERLRYMATLEAAEQEAAEGGTAGGLAAGAYTRPLFNSTKAVSDTNTPYTPPNTP